MLWQLSAYGIIIWLARYPKIRKAKQQLLLFGIVSGSYFVVSRQECRLNAFYLRRPRCILGITWRDRAPSKDPNWTMLFAPLSQRCLGWLAMSPACRMAGSGKRDYWPRYLETCMRSRLVFKCMREGESTSGKRRVDADDREQSSRPQRQAQASIAITSIDSIFQE